MTVPLYKEGVELVAAIVKVDRCYQLATQEFYPASFC